MQSSQYHIVFVVWKSVVAVCVVSAMLHYTESHFIVMSLDLLAASMNIE